MGRQGKLRENDLEKWEPCSLCKHYVDSNKSHTVNSYLMENDDKQKVKLPLFSCCDQLGSAVDEGNGAGCFLL